MPRLTMRPKNAESEFEPEAEADRRQPQRERALEDVVASQRPNIGGASGERCHNAQRVDRRKRRPGQHNGKQRRARVHRKRRGQQYHRPLHAHFAALSAAFFIRTPRPQP